MSCKKKKFKGLDEWWIIVLFFLFLVFEDTLDDICMEDWIPFLIILLIICSCDDLGGC
ncbi:hypothetical protein SAMN05661008_00234 [Alkalithermobacter thermoalcaliphilus JW-YL-7 = DSM 7308]|uniref:Uncharacterized protein n=1 Tax=Alkalithermobacter thermoalcaliphilus JW-YL-7 = DSM 7308 TaxID=1121328 RepID=A0A150FRI1_CLOPD|nr:hypothetical protein JWYL7_1289 [[Clostridium] paradoxum JW-YL-7 = DSM 7308]SHK42356.1 hypothetical protein SAMN05661008_00234 [[Clostridium] paradoxum JW-YL-7 = DSM 7308]